jgi:hypothetical protein
VASEIFITFLNLRHNFLKHWASVHLKRRRSDELSHTEPASIEGSIIVISQISENELTVVREAFERHIVAASITRDIEMDQYERIKKLEKDSAIQNDQIAVLTEIVTQLGIALFINGLLSPNIARAIRDAIFATAENPLSESAHMILRLLDQWAQQSPKEP